MPNMTLSHTAFQVQTRFDTPYCLLLSGSPAPTVKDRVGTSTALLLPGSSKQPGPQLALPFSLCCGTLSCSAGANPPLLLWGCLFNSFSANLVYIKPIWSETGLFRDVAGLSIQQPAPSWEEADMQKRKNLQTIWKDLLKIIWLS